MCVRTIGCMRGPCELIIARLVVTQSASVWSALLATTQVNYTSIRQTESTKKYIMWLERRGRHALVADVVRACGLERASAAVEAALQAITQMAALPALQARPCAGPIFWQPCSACIGGRSWRVTPGVLGSLVRLGLCIPFRA